MRGYVKLSFFMLFVCIVCVFILSCAKLGEINNVDTSDVEVIIYNPQKPGVVDYEFKYPNSPEYQKMLSDFLSEIRMDRGNLFSNAFTSYAPSKLDLIFNNLKISFGEDDLIVSTINNDKALQSVRKMKTGDYQLLDKLLSVRSKNSPAN